MNRSATLRNPKITWQVGRPGICWRPSTVENKDENRSDGGTGRQIIAKMPNMYNFYFSRATRKQRKKPGYRAQCLERINTGQSWRRHTMSFARAFASLVVAGLEDTVVAQKCTTSVVDTAEHTSESSDQ